MSVDRLERVNSLLKRVIAEGVFVVMQGDTVAPGLITITVTTDNGKKAEIEITVK